MATESEKKFFIRSEDGRVFGPVDLPTLVEWARDSRIEPAFSVSSDRESWQPAPSIPDLGMTWVVETEPGAFYGPFNRAVVDSLMEAGSLARDARVYSLDSGKKDESPAEKKPEPARKEVDWSKFEAAIAAEKTKFDAEMSAERAKFEAERAVAQSELESAKADV